jgi:polygalacturonase
MVIDPQTHGASGDGRTKDTAALQRALDTCAAGGGGTVHVPAGRYLTGPIYLRSHVTLDLAPGAVILGSQDRDDYAIVERRYSGTRQRTVEALINGDDLENIAITGRGAIDGQGSFCWQPIRDYFAAPKAERDRSLMGPCSTDAEIRRSIWHRPRLVEPVRCRDVVIDGVTLQNSGFWNLHPLFCENVKIHGVTLRNPYDAPNADGIDLDSCRNVTVSDCLIDVGDDCICLKSGMDADGRDVGIPTENVAVSNCVTRGGHGGIVIGSDMSGGVRNVAVSNCVFDGTDIGVRLKTRRGRGGVVEQVMISNIVMTDVPVPLVFNMHYAGASEAAAVDETTPRYAHVHISNVTATGARRAGVMHGLAEQPITGVALTNVQIEAAAPIWRRHVAAVSELAVGVTAPDGTALPTYEDGADIALDPLQIQSGPGH